MAKNDFSLQSKIPSGKKVGSIALLVLALAVFLPIVVGGSSEAVRRQLVSSYPELMAWLEPIYLVNAGLNLTHFPAGSPK
jgi:hypothetical protein